MHSLLYTSLKQAGLLKEGRWARELLRFCENTMEAVQLSYLIINILITD